ncbi:WhiB family transcriptional regulator [Mycobacterium sp. WMMD1722]|uniref:WhiB family transcriptional regulator n=1 Tax=Mycobacterium sp. WMMD1722 TaxID=3404117 RepID=UPI003BF54BEA
MIDERRAACHEEPAHLSRRTRVSPSPPSAASSRSQGGPAAMATGSAVARTTTGRGGTVERVGGQRTPRAAQAAASCRLRQDHGITAWQLCAACAGMPQEMFFPPDGERGRMLWRRYETAKKICLSCPVIEACRAHALDTAEQYGVWGATTPLERRRLIQARLRASASMTAPLSDDIDPAGIARH